MMIKGILYDFKDKTIVLYGLKGIDDSVGTKSSYDSDVYLR